MAELAQRRWLDVPFDSKDAAKAAGARWDPQARSWYAPRPDMPGLERWGPLAATLPGEDRGFGSGLYCDPIPRSAWYTQVRSAVSTDDWHRLRQMVYRRAGQACEACGAGRNPDGQRWLEAHERFAYLPAAGQSPGRGVQQLRRLVCLCTWCHEATHFGRAQVTGREQHALDHLCWVNGWSARQAWEHVDAAAATWEQRSAMVWELDLSLLTAAGIMVDTPPAAEQRPAHADAALRAELDAAAAARVRERAATTEPGRAPEPGVGVRAVGPGGGGDDPMSRILRGQSPFPP